jgi:hypothetical protein
MTRPPRSLGLAAFLLVASLLSAGHVVAQTASQAPPSPAASLVPGALNFLIQDTWNDPDPFDQGVQWSTGSFTIQGALPIAWLLTATPDDGEELGDPWPASGSQQLGQYDGNTCSGEVLVDCGTCTVAWISQWGEDPRLTIVSRDARTVAVDDWSTADPSAADGQFVQPGCENATGTEAGRDGMGHIELDVTFDGETPTAIAIQPGFDLSSNKRFVDPNETLAVQLLH